MVDANELLDLLLGRIGVVNYPLDAVAYNGQRRLQFVRGVTDKTLLLFEQMFRALDSLLRRLIQLAELGNSRVVWDIFVLMSWLIAIEPIQ